jgi:hypothetical protein
MLHIRRWAPGIVRVADQNEAAGAADATRADNSGISVNG